MGGTLPPPQPAPPIRRTNRMAMASLCCGIGSLFVVITSVLAVIFGHVALREIRADPNQDGRRMALAGVIMGWIVLGIIVATLVLFVLARILSAVNGR